MLSFGSPTRSDKEAPISGCNSQSYRSLRTRVLAYWTKDSMASPAVSRRSPVSSMARSPFHDQ